LLSDSAFESDPCGAPRQPDLLEQAPDDSSTLKKFTAFLIARRDGNKQHKTIPTSRPGGLDRSCIVLLEKHQRRPAL
jgi:hypothetical protein